MNQTYPSHLLEEAVNEFSKLPGIGKKTALRLVLHLLKQQEEQVNRFGNAMIRLKQDIKYCKICHTITDQEICPICSNLSRNDRLICVVENVREVMAVENTGQFNGLYHVLGGLISPMDGIGPSVLEIESLVDRVTQEGADEVLLALPATMEGDTTAFYIYKKLAHCQVAVTTIARGIAVGDELEYADEVTLGRSILNRIEYKG
jgi:recombination protein RecR